jgi:hypothetical protein
LSFLWLAIAGLTMSSIVIDDVRVDRAGFDGTLLACLAFGESKPIYITDCQLIVRHWQALF